MKVTVCKSLIRLLKYCQQDASDFEDRLDAIDAEIYDLSTKEHHKLWPYVEEDLGILDDAQTMLSEVVLWLDKPKTRTNHTLDWYENKLKQLKAKKV